MNKKGLFVFFMVGLVFLYGCTGDGDGDQTGDVETPDSPFIGGDDGVVAEFLDFGVFNENSDTEEIFEGESFPIEVLIENKGEEDLAPGDVRIELLGVNLADFSGIVSAGLENTEEISGVSEFNSVGEEETVDFTPGDDAVYLKDIVGNSIDLSVFGRVVYRYKTFASVPKVCFKEDLEDEGVCEVEESKDVFSSSAPIQVASTAEEKRAGTGKIAVEFEVTNEGEGEVTLAGEPFDSRFDEVAFSVSEPDLWECKSGGKEGVARLDKDGKATVVCRLREPMEQDALFTKQLDLTFDYDYKFLIHRQIRVRRQ